MRHEVFIRKITNIQFSMSRGKKEKQEAWGEQDREEKDLIPGRPYYLLCT